MNLDSMLELAIKAANAGSKAILDTKELNVKKKENNTPLSAADLASNDAIINVLQKSKIPICSEEAPLDYNVRKNLKSFWLIDPLDGTKGYIKGSSEYCILIALIRDFRPILGVILQPKNDIFYAHIDSKLYKNHTEFSTNITFATSNKNKAMISSSDKNEVFLKINNLEGMAVSSALKFCYILDGKAGVYARFENLNSWDIAAGDFLINHSGGFMGDLQHNLINYNAPNFRCAHFIATQNIDILESIKLPQSLL